MRQIDAELCRQLERIPVEERITLLTIRKIALWIAQGLPVAAEDVSQELRPITRTENDPLNPFRLGPD